MLSHEAIRRTLLAQRRGFSRQAVQTEEDLRWFQSDIESEAEERGQEETMVRLLDRLDGRAKAGIEAIDQALVRTDSGQHGRCATCGRDIPLPRLEGSTMCVACAQAGKNQAAPGK